MATVDEKFAHMVTGKLYHNLDREIEALRNESTEKTNEINAESDPKKKQALIKELFGSVVTHDIPANVIAAGNSCKVIRPVTEAGRTGMYD